MIRSDLIGIILSNLKNMVDFRNLNPWYITSNHSFYALFHCKIGDKDNENHG